VFGRFYRFRRKTFKMHIVLFVIFLICISLFAFFEKQVTPSLYAISEAKTRIIVTEAINKAVKEKIVKNVQYKDLISIHKNTYGQVALIQINTIEINRLETETTLEVVETLREVTLDGIKMPLGMITGSKILANSGPIIKVHLNPVGSVEVNTTESFEEAGINQTRHKVILEITAEIKIVQPLFSSKVTVKNDVPVAETIIVGNVPQAILDLK
jgi:sporulation protein YunB